MVIEDHGEIVPFTPALVTGTEPPDYVTELEAVRRIVDAADRIVNELEDEDMRRRVVFHATDMIRRNLA